MPVQHAIWKVGEVPQLLESSRLASEQQLEEMIVRVPSILSSNWMLIGRQEPTTHGGRIDLLGIAPDSSLVVIELKRDRTPRETVAQALDYASWVEHLGPERIADIFRRFSDGGSLSEAFRDRFGADLDEDTLNASHQIIVVAAELDDSTERIVGYLNDRDVPINVVSFQIFQYGQEQFLSRAWLIDPGETQANVVSTTSRRRDREPWNGEFYVSYGPTTSRSWSDAREYGFISAGGGTWYTQTLKLLSPGDRIWVKIPGTGYVGVGRVQANIRQVNEFTVETAEGARPVLDVVEHADQYRANADNPEKAEFFVAVQWLDAVPETQAFNEVGLFGNQNTVCRPAAPNWRHTIERLKAKFPGWQH